MAFHEVRFPDDISYGSVGGPGFSTAIIENESGREQRIARWSTARRKYDAAYGIKSSAQIANLITFYIARQGPANGFRYKDFQDFSTGDEHIKPPGPADFDIGVGDGSTVQFQLQKKYSSGGVTRVRNITKPVSGTTRVSKDGVEQSSGFSVSTTTGIVTFTTAPASNVIISAGTEFDVPVRFGRELDEFLPVSYDEFDNRSVSSIPLIEDVDETEVAEEYFFGGSKNWGNITASQTISLQDGRVHYFLPLITGLSVFLPDPTTNNIPLGGPIFYIYNGGSQNLSIIRPPNSNIKVLTPGSSVTILLTLNSSGTKLYLAHG